MSVIGHNSLIGASGQQGYTVGRSLRLRSSASAYLNRTPASASNRTTWTWSGWVKKAATTQQGIYSSQSPSSSADYDSLEFYQDTIRWYFNGTLGSFLRTTAVYRDPSAWYHIIASVDTTQATASNRMKLYINGVQVTAFTNETYPSQNYNTFANNTYKQAIGAFASATSTAFFDGYLAEVNFIDGQALTPSSFGAYDTNGIWQPVKYSGTYGTNGFYLPFSNTTSTTTLVQDSSGNGNNWTPNNISLTAGTTYDSMVDSPTVSVSSSNYATLNPLDASLTGTSSITNGNLQQSATTVGDASCAGTIGVSSGKWYWEVTGTAGIGNSTSIGIRVGQLTTFNNTSFNGGTSTSYIYRDDGFKRNNGTASSYGASYTTNDVIGVALDMDAGTLTFYKNGTSQGTAYSSLSGTIFPANSAGPATGTTTLVSNFGQRPFTYTPPTGYNALNTYNLPTPTIKNGALYNAATLWTGNGTSQSPVNSQSNGGNNALGKTFYPDFVWYKGRDTTYNHALFDSIRGTLQRLSSNLTSAETTTAGSLTAFNSNGFSVGSDAGANQSSSTYVAWQWNAGSGSSSSNTNGSITSTVSANTTAGFSIVTYTGTGANATVGHGLGVAPSMIIVKSRSSGVYSWAVYHTSTGSGNYLTLNATTASTALAAMWNSTAPTSSVFSVGTDNWVNANTATYVAYCFAAVAGYSAFGKYTGNGSSDGPFCYLGFRPRWLMWKRTDVAGDGWWITDSTRNTYNVANLLLYAQSSTSETTSPNTPVDYLSNGFKIRNGTDGSINGAGGTYIYAAFAENPFNYSRAR